VLVLRIKNGEPPNSKNVVAIRKLFSEGLLIQTATASAKKDLEKNTTWIKRITESAQITRKRFLIIAHEVLFTSIDIINQKNTINNIIT
jgi:hypothetical protein